MAVELPVPPEAFLLGCPSHNSLVGRLAGFLSEQPWRLADAGDADLDDWRRACDAELSPESAARIRRVTLLELVQCAYAQRAAWADRWRRVALDRDVHDHVIDDRDRLVRLDAAAARASRRRVVSGVKRASDEADVYGEKADDLAGARGRHRRAPDLRLLQKSLTGGKIGRAQQELKDLALALCERPSRHHRRICRREAPGSVLHFNEEKAGWW